MSKYVDIGERLIAWAESLTGQEKAEARQQWVNGKHNSAFECGKTCAVRWKNLPHGSAERSATSERFWSVGQSNSFGKLEARRNYLVGKFPRLGSQMGITDALRCSRDSYERLNRPRSGQCA